MMHEPERELIEDALRELVNIGSGHAVTSLCKLLQARRVTHTLPECIDRRRLLRLYDPSTRGMCVRLGVRGAVSGTFLLLLPAQAAHDLLELLLGTPPHAELTALEESALREVGNIVCSAFVGAVDPLIDGTLLPTPPTALPGPLVQRMEEALEPFAGVVVGLVSQFSAVVPDISGHMVFIADEASALAIARAMGVV